MKIDLHVHSSERSWCCVSFEREQIESAISAGLDAIVLTDHNLCVSPSHLARLNAIYAPFKVFGGVEITLVGREKRNEDVIVLGGIGRDIERWNWSSDYAGLHKYVRDCGGFIMLAHAFRYSNTVSIDIEKYPVDALELYSNNITDSARESILRLAKERGITRFFSNSDAHSKNGIGRYYNVLNANPTSEVDLVRALISQTSQMRF